MEILNTYNLKEQLLYEINHSKPETLEMLYYFIQNLKTSFSENVVVEKNQKLSEFSGVIDNERADEMLNCINNEFNKIEGEW